MSLRMLCVSIGRFVAYRLDVALTGVGVYVLELSGGFVRETGVDSSSYCQEVGTAGREERGM